jgi:hypothetical protein
MAQRKSVTQRKRAAGVLLGAVASTLTAAALSEAGQANATCVSISGLTNGGGCTSTPGSVALGLGQGATANADGIGNLAVAAGNPGPNSAYKPPTMPTQALARGTFNTSLAIGDGTNAGSYGRANTAIAVGNGNNAYSFGGYPDWKTPAPSDFNTSIVVGKNSNAYAVGPTLKAAGALGNGKTSSTAD